ncbi:bifunctional hydroxymethylpyrimidine kinase/phosphomethylpyrimidine kinase [Aliarcobacter skirrowii]|uniref:bifunctional hydroxymethylpyrimidine kinase/phosphomethylpyrimidine kinase n=1 Tax=Aliarcobacter skirrowii TaxID=28200 RepID=UPI0029B36001|nr:bifunctional hydroxymethylpyrimidine kinase/phosphomethylpyrimidine kinase [Aliarcobacter skirrowii]MDX4036728.1 bifunctional hydroxymethylpyrimidine kinase/phosphomethylpyrimidine kinase [Aliarcobacter skirrowii]
MKKVLTIAGSDCIGGAGIQADLKTFSSFGTYGMSVVTAVVAENTFSVVEIQDVTSNMIQKQLEAVFDDIVPDVIKIGMLGNIDAMRVVSEFLQNSKQNYKDLKVVVDPVMYAKNGAALMDIKNMNSLITLILPLADIITPNIAEAQHLANMKIESKDDIKKACKIIFDKACKNVLIKGGDSFDALDILFDGNSFFEFASPKIKTTNTHGTGCTFSSAIAANLALGNSLKDSIQISKEYIYEAIKNAPNLGKGNGPTNHFYKFFKGE